MGKFLTASLAALAAAACLGVATAGAATRQVLLGEQGKPPAGTPPGATLNQMFPASIQINAGDKVMFTSRTFHTATYVGAGKPGQLFVPDPAGGKYTGIADSTGNPFFFDGLTKLIYNLAAFAPAGGTAIDGSKPVSSGVLSPGANGKAVSATFTFPKVGTYKLLCAVHPGMTANVVVKAAGAPVATEAAVKAAASTETATAWTKAAKLAATKVPANTVYAGLGGKTAILGFFPKKLTVKAGTRVNFVAKSPSEVHNVGFGPKKYLEALMKKVDLFPFGPGKPNQVPPFFLYGSEPAGGYTFDGSNHGNGFLATPLTDAQPGSPPAGLAGAARITFTKAGTFRYICLLHGPDMNGTIVVTP